MDPYDFFKELERQRFNSRAEAFARGFARGSAGEPSPFETAARAVGDEIPQPRICADARELVLWFVQAGNAAGAIARSAA